MPASPLYTFSDPMTQMLPKTQNQVLNCQVLTWEQCCVFPSMLSIIDNNLNYKLVSKREKKLYLLLDSNPNISIKKNSFFLISNPLDVLSTGNLYICHIRLEVFAFIMLHY